MVVVAAGCCGFLGGLHGFLGGLLGFLQGCLGVCEPVGQVGLGGLITLHGFGGGRLGGFQIGLCLGQRRRGRIGICLRSSRLCLRRGRFVRGRRVLLAAARRGYQSQGQ